MNNELHTSLLMTLKESATNAYNAFSVAYEKLNENKEESKKRFIEIIKSSDFLLSSMDYYMHLFKDIDTSEDILYVSQIITLLIKASHNLIVIAKSDNNDKEIDLYDKKKESYKDLLYFYYLLGEDNVKLQPILDAFIKDTGVGESNILAGYTKYNEFMKESN